MQRFTRASDPWFYLHAERLTKGRSTSIAEAIPIVDYLFRYDRGAFWGGKYAFAYFMTPFNRITRYLLDPFMRTRVMYHALHESGLARQAIVQDLAFPFSTAQSFIEYLHAILHFFPLWLCPIRSSLSVRRPNSSISSSSPSPSSSTSSSPSFAMGKHLSATGKNEEMLINIGVWGMGPANHDRFVQLNRAIEGRVGELGGLKCLYAHAYYTEEEFWTIYDRQGYDALRLKYHATTLPTVYDKVKVDLTPHHHHHPENEKDKDKKKMIMMMERNGDVKGGERLDWQWQWDWNERWWNWLMQSFWNTWPVSGLWGVWKAARGGDYLLVS